MARCMIFFVALSLLCSHVHGDVTVSTCAELKAAASGEEDIILGADIDLSDDCNSIPVGGSLKISGGVTRFAIDGVKQYGGAFVVTGAITVARVTFQNIPGPTLLSKNGGNISVSDCVFYAVEQAILTPSSADDLGQVLVTSTTFQGNGRCISALTATVTASNFVGNLLAGVESVATSESAILTSSLTVRTTTFTQNLFRYAITGPSVAVENCIFDHNAGGAIAGGGKTGLPFTVWVSACNFTGNGGPPATEGGAIAVSSSPADVYVEDSRFEENVSGGFGGAITLLGPPSGGKRSIVRTVFYSNVARSGGAVATKESLTIANSTFVNNNASESGGAIFVEPSAGGDLLLEITGSGFAVNNAESGGGAVSVSPGGDVKMTLMSTAFARNVGTTHGSALSLQPDSLSLLSCGCAYMGLTKESQVHLGGLGTAKFYPPLMAGTFDTQGGGSILEASTDSCGSY